MKEKVESEVFEIFVVMNELKEEFVVICFLLKEVEDKVGEVVMVYESLVIVKEEWEVEKVGFESDFWCLEKEKFNLEVEMEVLRLELGEV